MSDRLTLTAPYKVPPPRLSDHLTDPVPVQVPRLVRCSWAPCSKEFREGEGYGTLCSKACFVAECEADAEPFEPASEIDVESRLETELRWSLAFAELQTRVEALEQKAKEHSHMVPV